MIMVDFFCVLRGLAAEYGSKGGVVQLMDMMSMLQLEYCLWQKS